MDIGTESADRGKIDGTGEEGELPGYPTCLEEASVAPLEGEHVPALSNTQLQPDGAIDDNIVADVHFNSDEATMRTSTCTDSTRSSLLAAVGERDLLLTNGESGKESVRAPLKPHEQTQQTPQEAEKITKENTSVAGTGRRAARVLSGKYVNTSRTAAARERVRIRLAERNDQAGRRGRGIIRQAAGPPPPSLLLESGPRE